MKRDICFLALLLTPVALIGCAGATNSTSGTNHVNPGGDWTNWQIQAGTAITSPPNTYPSFLGAIQIEGTQASGIFTTIYPPGTPTPSSTVLNYSGTYVASTGDISLATYGNSFGYTEPATSYTLVPVNVIGGCVYPPGYTGPECLAITSSPSVGVAVGPLNGTYAGTLTDATTPGYSGPATLTLAQSSTPNASGQFPLTATLVFPANSGLGTQSLAGTISGEGLTLSYASAAVGGEAITVTASSNPEATQLTVSSLQCSSLLANLNATFTGTLTLQ